MANLVSGIEVMDYLGISSDDEGVQVALALADEVEALLVKHCGRTDRPWMNATTGRVEVKDGTGRALLYLDYPIAALTSVKLGYDSANPVETLVVNDQTKLVHKVGSSRLVRVDGGVFGSLGQPNYVHVTYNTAEDVPADAAVAVKRGVAAIWRQRGSEDAKSEHIGGVGLDLAAVLESDPVWQRVVGMHRAVFA